MSDTVITGSTANPGPAEPSAFITPLAAADMPVGTPVYATSTPDTVNKANAGGAGTARALGLLVRPVKMGERCLVQTRGPLTLTDADWKAIHGAASLVVGVAYYLSAASAGTITATAPSAGGDFVIPIGVAASVETLIIAPQPVYQSAL